MAQPLASTSPAPETSVTTPPSSPPADHTSDSSPGLAALLGRGHRS